MSPAKYPAPELLPAYESLLSGFHSYGNATHIPKHNRYHLNATEFSYAEQLSHTAAQTLKEYGGKTFTKKVERPLSGKPLNVLGVGPFPSVASVSNLLLFNTEFNPYRSAFQQYDPLEGQEKPKQTVVDDKRDQLGAQPATILEGDALPMASLAKISYVPDLGDVPVFELPDQLPDLPGIADLGGADRTSWGSGIAPSLGSAAFMDLPEISSSSSITSSTTSGGAAPPPPSASSSSAPPPPPPPSGAGGPPPPPPPPPPSGGAAPPAPPPPAAKSQRENIPPPESSGDARQDLLASIRAGKSLRAVSDDAEGGAAGGGDDEEGSKRRRRKNAKAPPAKDSGAMASMFSNFLTALENRRKGMTAQKEIVREEPAAAAAAPAASEVAAPSAAPSIAPIPSLGDDSAVAAPSTLRLILPEEQDDAEDDEDSSWLDE